MAAAGRAQNNSWSTDNVRPDQTGQTLVLPVILTGHFLMRTFCNIFHIVVASCILLYNAKMFSFFFCCFLLLCTKPFKEKEHRNKFHVVMKCDKAKQQQTELWSNATMQQVGTVRSALL